MSTKSINSIFQLSKKNIIILILVGALGIQNLAFQIIFRLNFPYSIDFSDVFSPLFNQIIKDEFSLLVNKGIHIILFPKLISYPNFYLNSFDVVNLTYLYWIVMSLTLFVTYLLIRQTDRRLLWTLIPISAFLYSPLTTSGYWSVGMLAWYFPMLGIICTIYILNKKNINSKIFASGVSLTIFSTFSILIGVISWIAGFLILIKSISEKRLENKKWIILWISSSLITGFVYLSLTSGLSEPINFDLLFSFSGFSFITNFLSSSFRLKYQTLMILVGSLSIILSIIYCWYFIKKDYFKQFFPWFVFLLTAFFGSVITAIGRLHLEDHFGNEPYYSPISQLFHIGLILLTAKILLEFRKNPQDIKKKIIIAILISIILSQMILLIPSYYSGWQRGHHYFDEKSEFVNCFSLHPEKKCLEVEPMNFAPETLSLINYLIVNEQSIFNEKKFQKLDPSLLQKFSSYNLSKNSEKIGSVLYINDQSILNHNYELKDEIFKIDGWIQKPNYENIDKIYLSIDNELLVEYDDFQISEFDNSSNLKWSLFMMSGYIPNGCNSLSIFTIINNEKILLDSEISICK